MRSNVGIVVSVAEPRQRSRQQLVHERVQLHAAPPGLLLQALVGLPTDVNRAISHSALASLEGLDSGQRDHPVIEDRADLQLPAERLDVLGKR